MEIKIDNKDFQVNDGVPISESIIKKNFKKREYCCGKGVNEKLQDLSECIVEDSEVQLITTDDKRTLIFLDTHVLIYLVMLLSSFIQIQKW